MQWYWGILMAIMGAYMLLGGLTKGEHVPYRWFHARASLLWKESAHTFLAVSGATIAALGIVAALGIIW